MTRQRGTSESGAPKHPAGTAPRRPLRLAALAERRSWHAQTAVARLHDLKREQAVDYATEVRRLAARIHATGLGQTLAYLQARARDKKPALKQLHADLADWILHHRPVAGARPDSLLESIVHGPPGFLRRATDEALAYLHWLDHHVQAGGWTGEGGGS